LLALSHTVLCQFGASVTMDMEERYYDKESSKRMGSEELRKITFKCVESAFFSKFDGEWTVSQQPGGKETKVEYVVDVRPRGPVPVSAAAV